MCYVRRAPWASFRGTPETGSSFGVADPLRLHEIRIMDIKSGQVPGHDSFVPGFASSRPGWPSGTTVPQDGAEKLPGSSGIAMGMPVGWEEGKVAGVASQGIMAGSWYVEQTKSVALMGNRTGWWGGPM